MPTYQYVCTECGNDLEVVQKFTDQPLTECPACHGQLRKVFYPVGVVFKGSGFYRTDSRAQDKQPVATGSGGGSADGKSDGAAKSRDTAAAGDKGKPSTETAPKKRAASTPAA